MKKLQALSLLILGFLITPPDLCLAQKKFMGNPVAEHFEIEIDSWFSWRIDQDERGMIYILTGKTGISIFSGGKFVERIEAPPNSRYHSIFVGPSGRVYVGGTDLGYYFPGPSGRYEYHSLSPLLPEPVKINGRNYIKYIFMYDEAIVFAKDDSFYFYKNDSLQVVQADKVHASGTIKYHDKLYNLSNKGLVVYENGGWQLIENGEFFKNKNIAELIEYSHEAMLVVTFKYGLFRWDKEGVVPFASEVLDYDQITILSARRLSDGNFALGTRMNGLYILSPAGKLIYHYNKENILRPDSEIWNIFEDSFGNIWLVRPHGMFKIEWNSPLSRIDQSFGLSGNGIAAEVIGDELYLSTSEGLFVSNNNWPLNKFRQVEEVNGSVHLIKNIQGDWLFGGKYGLYQLTDKGFKLISSTGNWWRLVETENPNIILGGNYYGIYRIEKSDGLWSKVTKYKDSEHVAPLFVFDESNRLWATSSKGLYSFTFTEDYKAIATTHHYDTLKGLPYNHSNGTIKLEDKFLVTSLDGIYEFDQANDRFKPSSVWNDRFGPYGSVIRKYEMDANGNYYYSNFNSPYPKRLKRDRWGQYINEPNLLKNIPDVNAFVNISVLDEENILFSYGEGFVHYDVASQNEGPDEIKLLIRYIRLTRSDSLLFGGHFTHNDEVVVNQPSDNQPKIPYGENSLVIGYAAVEFNNYSQTYRYKLEGYDDEWSSWNGETEKEYMNLWEGDYTFKVEAQNVKGDVLPMQTYRFSILPPWYRTWLAYCIYALGVLGLFGGIFIVYRRRKLKQITHLENKQLESEVQHKQTQLATTAMHLIEKTDFIRSIKTRISQILKDEDMNVNRELKRIVREIDRNSLQQDVWEDFERHFDAVHTGFLQKIQKDYPNITPQDVKLSAYLRMNLSSKEIANLMQITPRSVEVARYRLRKKLGLDSEENLASFMMNY